MSLFLVSCIDGISIPDFPQVKKQSADKAAPPENASDDPDIVPPPVKKIKTETLLDEEGNWNLVEKSEAIDPMQAHLAARNKVDIKRRKNNKELSAHFKPNAKSGEDGKMRVLRLEHDDNELEDDEIAKSSIAKPTHTIAESDLLNRVKSIFGEYDADSKGFVIPKVKPVLGVSGWQGYTDINPATAKKSKSSEDRIVSGVILPPELPERKSGQVITKSAIIVSAKSLSKNLSAEKIGVIVPKRKPIIGKKLVKVKKPVIKKTATKKQVYNDIKKDIKNTRVSAIRMRSGKHPGKTRLVIEVTKATKYKVAIDHVRNVLRVKLYDTQWNLSPQENFTKSSLLGTYIARDQKDGSVILEVRMKKKTKILDTIILRPNMLSKYRVVIDLKD